MRTEVVPTSPTVPRPEVDTPTGDAVEVLDTYLATDMPTCCPACQRRSCEFVTLGDGREQHTCVGCGFQFLVSDRTVEGEEQCEGCREFFANVDLDGDDMCARCRDSGASLDD